MLKRKKFTRMITANDVLDVTLVWENRRIIKFALNYRSLIDDNWKEIYRVDNFHGFLHEQRFWRNSTPIALKEEERFPLEHTIEKYVDIIFNNFEKFKKYFKISMKN